MDIKKLKQLRAELPMPIQQAKHLLALHGSVEACKTAFHANHLRRICSETDCELALAVTYYRRFNGNVTRIIERILKTPITVTTGYPKGIDLWAGFYLVAEQEDGSPYPSRKCEDLVIHLGDFKLLQEAFQSVFPYDGDNYFDVTDAHWFDNATARKIANEIALLKSDDTVVQAFYDAVMAWFEDKLAYADVIAIEGSL